MELDGKTEEEGIWQDEIEANDSWWSLLKDSNLLLWHELEYSENLEV